MTLYLRDDMAAIWPREHAFNKAASQQGLVFRAKEGRRTLRFEANGKSYFLKYHSGIGWREIFKNLARAKMPVTSAMNEVYAINAIHKAGIDTMTLAAYGEFGRNPAHIKSFVVTEDLTDTLSLEDIAHLWQGRPPLRQKRTLIRRLAQIAKQMHTAGINHRDFYLCHFLIKRADFEAGNLDAPLYLIDLHRSQVRDKVPRRWRVKDIGGLYFSAAPLALTRTDLLRFVREYTGTRGAARQPATRRFLRAAKNEAERLYRRHYHQPPNTPLPYQPVVREPS